MNRSYRWAHAALVALLVATTVVGAEIPVVPVAATQGSLTVCFSTGGIWFLLPESNLRYTGSPWGGGSAKKLFTPSILPFGRETNWLEMGASNTRGFGILSDHSLATWGHWDATNGNAMPVLRPIPFPTSQKWARIAVGDAATAGIDLEGRLWTWGDTTFAARGNPGLSADNTPAEPAPGSRWNAIAACGYGFGGLRTDGSAWVWGWFPWRSSGITHAIPKRVSPQTDWTELCSLLPLVLRNRSGELWNLPMPGNDYAWSQPLILLTNASPGRFALAGNLIWDITAEGRLWVRPNPALPPEMRETFDPRPVGDRTDWVRLWNGSGTVVGTTANGVVWIWGTDWFAEPLYSLETRAEQLVQRAREVAGAAPTRVSYSGTYRFRSEPVPALRLVTSERNTPPLRRFLGEPISAP